MKRNMLFLVVVTSWARPAMAEANYYRSLSEQTMLD